MKYFKSLQENNFFANFLGLKKMRLYSCSRDLVARQSN
jgi:hypothetical protein